MTERDYFEQFGSDEPSIKELRQHKRIPQATSEVLVNRLLMRGVPVEVVAAQFNRSRAWGYLMRNRIEHWKSRSRWDDELGHIKHS